MRQFKIKYNSIYKNQTSITKSSLKVSRVAERSNIYQFLNTQKVKKNSEDNDYLNNKSSIQDYSVLANLTSSGKTKPLMNPLDDANHITLDKWEKNCTSIPRNLPISEIIQARIKMTGIQDPFYVMDIGKVIDRHQIWTTHLPRVTPFYAVKSNPDKVIISCLASQGCGFDVASQEEMKIATSIGVKPEKMIFAHCAKQESHISYAKEKGIEMMTFDNEDELKKIKRLHPNAKCVLRVLTDNSRSLMNLGLKFGADQDCIYPQLKLAKDLDLNVCGISFHVGSGCWDPTAFSDAVEVARRAIDIGDQIGFRINLLDIGGGFPGTKNDGCQFEEIAKELNYAFEKLFDTNDSRWNDLKIIAEPGRFFSAVSNTLAVNIFSKRKEVINNEEMFMYYVNDGVYGSFNCLIFDHAKVTPRYINIESEDFSNISNISYAKKTDENSPKLYQSTIWGPTCDSIDLISNNSKLPELQCGDWLYFENMGAYTSSASSEFNGMKRPCIMHVNSRGRGSLEETVEWFADANMGH